MYLNKYIYIYMWQGPFGIMRTTACFTHATPASVLIPFLSPCLTPCSLQLVPLLLSPSLSLSPLLLSFSLHVYFGRKVLLVFHLFTCLSPLFSPGSILNFLPNHCHSSLRLLGKEWVSWPLMFLFTFLLYPGLLACISIAVLVAECFGAKPIKPIIRYVTLGLYRMLLYLPSYLFPSPLSTTALLSRSPGFGPERKGFLLFPFFITYFFL